MARVNFVRNFNYEPTERELVDGTLWKLIA